MVQVTTNIPAVPPAQRGYWSGVLSRLRRERNLTYLFVSHDLAVIDHMCDRLLVMKGGQAVEELAEGALSHRQVQSDYTRALMKASEGFVRPDAA